MALALAASLFALLIAAAAPVADAKKANPYTSGILTLAQKDFTYVSGGRKVCGRVGGKWVTGEQRGSNGTTMRFMPYARLAANYRAAAKREASKPQRKQHQARAKKYAKLAKASCGLKPLRLNLRGALGVAQGGKASGRRAHAPRQDTGTTLRAVLGDGSLRDAISGGVATIQSLVVAPDRSAVYLIFQQRVNLENAIAQNYGGGGCVIAKVPIDTGIPTCIDESLQNVQAGGYYSSYGNQKPIQFDALGGVYYSGYGTCGSSGCQYVLRRSRDGAVTDLVKGDSQVQSFTVAADGTVFMTGWTPATGRQFYRRLSPAGVVRNMPSGWGGNGFRLFPDGNAYTYFSYDWSLGPCASECTGLARWLVADDRKDDHLWIGDAASTHDWAAISGGGWGGFSSWDARVVTTSDDQVFYISAGHVDKAYPVPARFATEVSTVAVAQGAGTKVVIAGTNGDGDQLITLFDGATHTETRIAGPGLGVGEIEVQHITYSPSSGQVLFDGLRFADNKYVIGEIDRDTGVVSITSVDTGKLSDFQTF